MKEAGSEVQTGQGCRLEFIWSDMELLLITLYGLCSLLHPPDLVEGISSHGRGVGTR